MTGSVEPVFRFLTCRGVPCPDCARLGEKKYRKRSEDDFFLPTSPQGRLAQSRRHGAIFAGKNLKYEY